MKVFISWSGSLSKQVAEHLKSFVKCTLQAAEPFLSSDDIGKGAYWFATMGNELAASDSGLVCLAKDNLTAPWILFEAGALSKGLTKNRVCTLLVNVAPSDLTKPLSEFQATLPTEEDMLKLILSLNNRLEKPLEKETVQRSFSAFWPEFKTDFDKAVKQHGSTSAPKRRDQYDLVAELLQICRSMQQGLQQITEVRDFEQKKSMDFARTFLRIKELQESIAQNLAETRLVENDIARLEAALKPENLSDPQRKSLEEHLLASRNLFGKLRSDSAQMRFEVARLERGWETQGT